MGNSLWITDTSIHEDIYNCQVGNDRTKERKRTQDVAGGGEKSEGRREEVLRDGRWGIVVSSRRRREEDGRDRERERENKSTAPTCLLLAATLELDASTDVLKLRLKSCRQVLAGRGSSKIYLTESFLIFRREKSGSQATGNVARV